MELHAGDRTGVVHLVGVDQAPRDGPGVRERGGAQAHGTRHGAGIDGEYAGLRTACGADLEDRGGVDRRIGVVQAADLDVSAALRGQAPLAEAPRDGEGAAHGLDLVAGVQRGVAADAERAAGLQPKVDPASAAKRQRPGREGPRQLGVSIDDQGRRTARSGDGLGSSRRRRVDGRGVVWSWRGCRGLRGGRVGPVARRAPGPGQRAGPHVLLAAHDVASPLTTFTNRGAKLKVAPPSLARCGVGRGGKSPAAYPRRG